MLVRRGLRWLKQKLQARICPEVVQTPPDSLASSNPLFVPIGHFYSPIPDLAEIAADADRLFPETPREILEVDFQLAEQLERADVFAQLPPAPFPEQPTPPWRYYYNNEMFSFGDAVAYYSLLRTLQPRQVIEVGSGYTSALLLDVRDHFFTTSCDIHFIEPYPERLHSLLQPSDHANCTILPQRLQDVPVALFTHLKANDILFIDSTHVAKTGSDVCWLLFEVLPRLAPGVIVHFHDIFYPFEYPRAWVERGMAWNEIYMIRAFLQYNAAFKIVWFNSYLAHLHHEYVANRLPEWHRNTGGSLWLLRQ